MRPIAGASAWLLIWAMSKVLPSPGCLLTKSAAITPAAPALFSITTDRFHMVASFWPTTRASASVPPPGGKPTTMRTGPLGKVWA
ncbi:MAG: hypothetical protein BWX79_02081 [Alphaproteobacteria bacterium ADurb.Bin100]|nr:MAG: hypothetical protein BWX79_02081 [Alphaproteobacteria bacterium ADurb.Bin100]